MKIKSYLIFFASLALFACKKHDVIDEPAPTSNLDSYFSDNLESIRQSFIINNTTGGEFTGDKGVIITAPADVFVYASGTVVSGEVNMELVEVLDYREMVRTNKSTVSGDDILVSGGQLKLTATKNGSQVYLAEGAALEVKVPAEEGDPMMALYDGNENADGTVEWTLAPESEVIVEEIDSADYYYFEFSNPDLGWVNCDYSWDSPYPRTTVKGHLSDEQFIMARTNGFIIFPDINSVASMYTDAEESTTYQMTLVPTGTQAKFMFISEIDDVYYKAVSSVFTVTADYEMTLDMVVTTLDDIEAEIADL